MKRYLIILLVFALTLIQTAAANEPQKLSIAVGDWPPYFDEEAPDQAS